jgi:hypothetical protein
MTPAGPDSAAATFKALWNRAPIWRLFLLSAILLTLLFALFPPKPPELAKTLPVAIPTSATYQSRASPSVTTPPTPPPTVTAPTDTLKSKSRAAVAPTATRSATPQTATLTMVTAGPAKSPNESGLDAALLGPLYRDAVTIDGFAIPLPPGAWTNLAHSTITEQSATGDVHFLGQIRNKRLIGAIRIFVAHSKDRPGAGFNEVKSCTEVNPGRTFVAIDDEMVPHGHQACWTIRDVYATPWSQWADRAVKLSSIDRAAAGDMTAKGVTFPQDFIMLTFTRTETWGLLEVGYLFSPESEGITSNVVLAVSETDWTPANISRYPDKVVYIDKLRAWGTAFWPKFKSSFAAATPPLDVTAPKPMATGTVP